MMTTDDLLQLAEGFLGTSLDICAVQAYCPYAESLLPSFIEEVVFRSLQSLFHGETKLLYAGNSSFYLGESLYFLQTITDAPARGTVTVRIEAVRSNSDSPLIQEEANVAFEGLFDGGGMQTKYALSVCPTLSSVAGDHIATSIKLGCEIFYRHLESLIKQSILTLASKPVTRMYDLIDTLFSQYIAEKIWLYAIVDGEGIYVSDQRVFDRMLNAASRRNLNVPSSPLQLASQFSSVLVPYGESFTRQAISSGRPVSGDFRTPLYSATGIQIAEMAIYETTTNIVQALVSEGKNLLAAGYPTSLRSEVEPVLSQNAHRFSDILAGNAILNKEKKGALKRMSSSDGFYGKLGEFTGGVIKSLIDPK